jgi:signal transduction histidine kinase
MGLHSVYFMGQSRIFLIFWLSYFLYFLSRIIYPIGFEVLNPFEYILGIIYQFILFCFLVLFHFYIQKDRLNQIKKMEDWKNETKKRIFLERELIALEERETILADIHDNVGGRLLEVDLLISRLEESEKNNSLIFIIKNKISNTIYTLKNRILELEDMDLLRKDLYWGLKNYLVRRYSVKEREISFFVDEDLLEYQNKFTSQYRKMLLEILQEIVNNDLRYGYGEAKWKFCMKSITQDKFLSLSLETLSYYSESEPNGRGMKILESRIQKAGGQIYIYYHSGLFNIEVDLGI